MNEGTFRINKAVSRDYYIAPISLLKDKSLSQDEKLVAIALLNEDTTITKLSQLIQTSEDNVNCILKKLQDLNVIELEA